MNGTRLSFPDEPEPCMTSSSIAQPRWWRRLYCFFRYASVLRQAFLRNAGEKLPGLKPSTHARFLRLSEREAGIDAIEALLDGALSAGSFVAGKKLLDILAHGYGTRVAQRGNCPAPAKGCYFLGEIVPVNLEILPCCIAGRRVA